MVKSEHTPVEQKRHEKHENEKWRLLLHNIKIYICTFFNLSLFTQFWNFGFAFTLLFRLDSFNFLSFYLVNFAFIIFWETAQYKSNQM